MTLKELIEKLTIVSSQNPKLLDKEIYVEGDCLPSELNKVKISKFGDMVHLVISEKLWPWMRN